MARLSSTRLRWATTAALGKVLAIGLTVWAIVPVLTERAVPLSLQPFPDSAEYADGAWQLGHGHGYVTFVDERRGAFGKSPRPPRYPFGTSAVLAPFAAVVDGFPHGVQVGSRTISALYVLAIVAAAWMLGGPWAAALAAIMVGSSPFAHVSAGLIMSDALAALITVGILICLTRKSRAAVGIAGGLAGALVCVRLLGVVTIAAVLFAAQGKCRRLIVAACAAPFIFGLALYQWKTFGSPFRTGYSYWLPGLHIFSASFPLHRTPLVEGPFVIPDKLNGALLQGVCPCGVGGSMSQLPNLAFYPGLAAGLFWVFAPPLTGLLGFAELVRDRATPGARFALVTILLNLVVVLFYFDQAARFVAPAASLLLVYGAASIPKLSARLWRAAPAAARRTRRFAPD